MAKAKTQTLLREGDGGLVRRTTLPGGLRIITEQVPGVRSAAFGVWVNIGSRDETVPQMGSAHYLEHLLFKGTDTRSAMDISASIEAVGGDLNAFTTKEHTCYYARVLDVDLPLAIDVVTDVVLNATLMTDDIEGERGVILEEIAMHDDDPSDVVHEEFAAALFGAKPLGRPILGTIDTIEAITPRAIRSFYRRNYTPDRMVVAAAGNLDHAAVVAQVTKAFRPFLEADTDVAPPRSTKRGSSERPAQRIVTRSTEQANLVLGVPGPTRSDPRRYAMAVLSTALGGGMSSRLFQEVREKRGLAYSVYSYWQPFTDNGAFGIYAGCIPTKLETVLEVCRGELVKLAEDGLDADELRRSKGQVRGATVLGQEDTGARMTRIAKAELVQDTMLTIDDILARVDAVTSEQIADLAADLASREATLAVIGPFESDRVF